jgi:hypothetical protein
LLYVGSLEEKKRKRLEAAGGGHGAWKSAKEATKNRRVLQKGSTNGR